MILLWLPLAIVLGVAVGVVTVILTIVALLFLGVQSLVSGYRQDLRRVHDAEAYHCPDCGAAVGREGLRLANELWIKREAQHRGNRPPTKRKRPPPLNRWLHAVCPGCGKMFSYLHNKRQFVPKYKEDPEPDWDALS